MPLREAVRSVLNHAERALNCALDWLYPRHCYNCEEPIRRRGAVALCASCFEDMRSRRLTGPACRTCGLPLAGATDPAATCGACIAEPRHFTVARALLPYAGPIVPVIRHFKFRGDFFLGPRVLEGALRAAWLSPDIDAPDIVAPVPLHPRRRRERGYDQALLLARVVARHFGCALERRALVRTRYTSQQSLLPVGRRLQNVRGAFTVQLPDRVAGRRVLLVDDVLTTGVTAAECARILGDAGAVETQVFTLARALP